MRKLASLLVIIGCSIAAPIVMAVDCPDGAKNVKIVNIKIGDSIKVEPEEAEIWLQAGPDRPGRVCWVVEGLPAGKTVRIGSSKAGQNQFSKTERKIKSTKSSKAESTGTPNSGGRWEYTVWVTLDGSTTPIDVKDPVIIIKDLGGG